MWLRGLITKVLTPQSYTPGADSTAALHRIASLSFEEAKHRVDALLLDDSRFDVRRGVPGGAGHQGMGRLSGATRTFLDQYESVRFKYSDLHIHRSALEEQPLLPGFLKLGEDVMDSEIVTRPKEDWVYCVDPTEAGSGEPEDRHRTIYHYILAAAQVVHSLPKDTP